MRDQSELLAFEVVWASTRVALNTRVLVQVLESTFERLGWGLEGRRPSSGRGNWSAKPDPLSTQYRLSVGSGCSAASLDHSPTASKFGEKVNLA